MRARTGILRFALFWSAIVSVFLALLAYGAYHQLRTLRFAQTQGTLDAIERTTHSDSDGTTYGIKLHYHFTVDGKRYDSDRRRYSQWSSGDNFADTFIRQHPKGSPITVYYDPDNPADAVLVQGLESFDLFLALFLTPFVCVGIGLWGAFVAGFRKSGIAGLRVIETPDTVRLRPSWLAIAFPGLIAAGITAFIEIFPIAFFAGSVTPMSILLAAHALWISASLLTMTFLAARILTGRADVRFDDRARLLTLPALREPLPYAQVRTIKIRRTVQGNANGTDVGFGVFALHDTKETPLYKGYLLSEPEAARLATFAALHLGCDARDPSNKSLTAPAPAS